MIRLKHILMALTLLVVPLVMRGAPQLPSSADSIYIVYIGDSNLWIGGDDCSNPRAWSFWFNKFIPASNARSYAHSGATWTNTSATMADTSLYSEVLEDSNVIYNELLRLIHDSANGGESPDIIFLSAGTNDAWFHAKRPGIFSVTTSEAMSRLESNLASKPSSYTSLTEAVTCGIAMTRRAFPEAEIVVLTPPETTATSSEMISHVADLITECAEANNVITIRLDKYSGISREKEKQHYELTTDGTHTSTKGAQTIATLVHDSLVKNKLTPVLDRQLNTATSLRN
jgi:lysophospholipase L1-like esterase